MKAFPGNADICDHSLEDSIKILNPSTDLFEGSTFLYMKLLAIAYQYLTEALLRKNSFLPEEFNFMFRDL